jgi:hypothetical protein
MAVIFTVIALLIVLWLLAKAYEVLPKLKVPSWESTEARPPFYDAEFLKETDSQRREGAWVGFLQEDVFAKKTGPLGDFVGNDSTSGQAILYAITA